MGIPDSRDYDAVDAGPLPHTTLNAIQDAVVDHESRMDVLDVGGILRHGDIAINFGTPELDNSGTALYSVVSNNGARWRVDIPEQYVGRRIKAWAVYGDTVVNGDTVLAKLIKQTATETTIDTDTNVDTTAGTKTLGRTLVMPETIAGFDRYFIQVELTTGAGSMKVYCLQVTFDRITN